MKANPSKSLKKRKKKTFSMLDKIQGGLNPTLIDFGFRIHLQGGFI